MVGKRKSRAGHPSGNYVRKKQAVRVHHVTRKDLELEAAAVTYATKAPITLAPLKFLERKKVAGEWL